MVVMPHGTLEMLIGAEQALGAILHNHFARAVDQMFDHPDFLERHEFWLPFGNRFYLSFLDGDNHSLPARLDLVEHIGLDCRHDQLHCHLADAQVQEMRLDGQPADGVGS